MGNLAEQIMDAAKTSLIDKNFESAEKLRPKLLYNDTHKGNTVLANLDSELKNCDSFWFSVAFITKSGLIVLKETLKELSIRNITGKILTTDYLEFNEPGALRELLLFKNLEVRIFTEEHFHTKGYMFKNQESYTFVVGSSNLTQFALKSNKEWNLKISSLEQGELMKETNEEFGNMWNHAISLTENWIKEYEIIYNEKKKVRDSEKIKRLRTYTLIPNVMQIEATRALAKLREENKNKALLISATGTGKTYLSAFDVRNYCSEKSSFKLLFLVHRKKILEQAEESYKDVMGESISTGILTGDSSCDIHKVDFLFSTTSLMSKEYVYKQFDKNYFDYIIIDEAHRAGAEGYLRFLNYFEPKFLLGMTATPERPDGFDVYQLFDHNIAYEVRLNKALEDKLLCPFHYFGITELELNGSLIDDSKFDNIFPFLISEERVRHIINKIQFYGHSGKRVKGLMFCRNIKEADELSSLFNRKGYRTVSINSKNDVDIEESIDKLAQDEWTHGLDYIFTVDMFNEGIDIPEVNQIVMLRPTQSNIIFVQQLGRGLRKSKDKEYLVVIDFIGNYKKNFLIPIALSGDRTYNKDNIRKYLLESNRVIPGCSTVNFDEITKERIFNSINELKGIKNIIKESYKSLKYKLGRVPSLMDFYDNGEVDPILILEEYKTYYTFLQNVEETNISLGLSEIELITLEYLSKIVARGKRPHELEILKSINEEGRFSSSNLSKKLKEKYNISIDEKSANAAFEVLKGSFVTNELEKQKYSQIEILFERNIGFYERMTSFYERMNHLEFRKQINDIINLGIKRYQEIYNFDNDRRNEFVLYKKYSRRDVCLLLNWGKDLSSTMYGMKRIDEDVAIFVTYNKATSGDEREYIAGKPDYADEFVVNSNQMFIWNSQIGKGPDSSYMQDVCEPKRKHLFIKKSDSEGTDFYYSGLVDVIEVKSDNKKDNSGKLKEISNVKFKLQDPIRDDLKDYLESK